MSSHITVILEYMSPHITVILEYKSPHITVILEFEEEERNNMFTLYTVHTHPPLLNKSLPTLYNKQNTISLESNSRFYMFKKKCAYIEQYFEFWSQEFV